MRAIRAHYNPYLQAKHRIEQVQLCIYALPLIAVCSLSYAAFLPTLMPEFLLFCPQLKKLGHSVDKLEYIGTFMALDEEYRDFFIRNLHDALSGHTSSSVDEAVRLVGQRGREQSREGSSGEGLVAVAYFGCDTYVVRVVRIQLIAVRCDGAPCVSLCAY